MRVSVASYNIFIRNKFQRIFLVVPRISVTFSLKWQCLKGCIPFEFFHITSNKLRICIFVMLHFTITRRTISYYNQDNIQFWWWSGFKKRCALIYFIKLDYVVNQWPFFRISFKTGLAIFKLNFWISCKTPESITKTDALALVNFLNMIRCCLQTLQIHLI